jgi:hypothetical protein
VPVMGVAKPGALIETHPPFGLSLSKPGFLA